MRTNITERKKAEEEAEKANQAKSEFLSSMSHELRTPMNSIMGFGQILESNSREPLTETQNKCVQHIMKSGQHLLELINQVLNLSEIEAGLMKLSIENVNLGDVIDDCLSFISSIADQNNISVHTVPISNIFVRADLTRLKQVILNLLSNAVKYNREGGRVSLHVAQDNDKVRVSVSDTGIGIPEERQHELFQPFSRLGAESSEVEGTGIGLNITRKIVEIMGGTIGFESIMGEGSIFWVELPIVKDQPSTDKTVSQGKEFLSTNKNIHGRILYIEDNPDNLELMNIIVSRMDGLDMLSAHSAELGLDLAVSEQPGLIILDINLPGMDGFEAVRHLKNNAKTRDIPVIALSANAMPRDIEKGEKHGFIHYLTKPINIDEVTSVIIELFEGKVA